MNFALSRLRTLCGAVTLALLAGCISIPPDHGRDDVNQWLGARGRDASIAPGADVDSLARNLLRTPLQPDDSVRLALLLNPDVRATYARLGIGSADLYDAGRLSNPRLSASLLESSVTSGERLTLGLAQSFTDLLLLPARSRIGQQQFTQLKQTVAGELLALAARVQESHYRVVGAQQIATMRELVATVGAQSAELAGRLHAAGNIKALELARERAAASEGRLNAMAARADAASARSDHARLLGVPAATTWEVEGRLAMPVATEDELESLLRLARESRLELVAARGRVDTLTAGLGAARKSRWLGDVEIGVEREREADGERYTGPTLATDLPLFNLRSGPALRAASELQHSRAELAGFELDVERDVRLAHASTLAARARAEEFRSVLIPAREAIVARTQEEQAFMLVGQFELLVAKQAEYDAYGGYLESVRDYWIARVQLAQTVGARLPSAPPADGALPAIEVPVPPGVTSAAPAGSGEPTAPLRIGPDEGAP